MYNERILIVEDEKIISLDLQRRLERFGYSIAGTTADGQDAIDKCSELKPSIVLMDIMLSGPIDGIESARIINKKLGIPVVFITAYADEKTLERAKEAEPFGYILKPFKERELYTTIDIALYKHRVDKQLKSQERLFSAILHSVNDAIIAIDMNLDILFSNPTAERFIGLEEHAIKGKPLLDFIRFSDGRNNLLDTEALLPTGNVSAPFTELSIKNSLDKSFIIDGAFTKIHEVENDIKGFVLAFHDVSKIKRMSATIDYQASHDSLTELLNREEFTAQLKGLLESLKKSGGTHTLLNLDIDRFKVVNETSGAIAGDELLRQIAQFIRSLTQRSDIAARLGSDEFAIILKDCSVENSLLVAKRLQDAVQSHKFIWQKNLFPITLSIGIVPLNSADIEVHDIFAAADDATYISKEEGGNRISIYKTTDEKYVQRRGQMAWIAMINEAFERDRFRLWYQIIEPIEEKAEISAKVELLIRLESQDGKILSPGFFIPSAERYGLMPTLDRWVVKNAIKSWTRLKEKKHALTKRLFSINLSGPTLLDEDFGEYILNVFDEYGADPHCFCFEITETSAIQNLTHASRFMSELKEQGFTFSLDDFGSGFSSFNYLKSLPVDYLKIDGAIVQTIDESVVNYTMVEAINSMGHVMGLKTVGEFVRNKEVLKLLRQIGVDYAQGYALSEPIPLPV